MEFCKGGELFDRVRDRKRYTDRKAAAVMRTILEVLSFCHARGIVHRDIKPENVLLCSKSSDTACKVIDFGIATFHKPGAGSGQAPILKECAFDARVDPCLKKVVYSLLWSGSMLPSVEKFLSVILFVVFWECNGPRCGEVCWAQRQRLVCCGVCGVCLPVFVTRCH